MKENMLSTSTSNSSFLNAGNYADLDDQMTILDCETRNYHRPMSKVRKMAFIASIVSILLVLIIFLLLPCNKNCVSKHHITKFTKTINWIRNYENVEFKGKINTIRTSNVENTPLNLIFMYRSDKIFPNSDTKKSKQKSNGGIIKLNGNLGEIVWKNEMTNEPRYLDCSLIDCNKNGRKDCLIIDDYGQLACIDDTGHWIYYNSNSRNTKQERQEIYDFPLIIPDLTSDDVYEIIMGSYKNNATYLVLLSGSNGKLLAEEIQNCSYIHKLQLDTEYVIKFICVVKDNTEQQIFKNLTDFYTLMTKKPKISKIQSASSIPQHEYSDKFVSAKSQTTVTKIYDKELKIENKGQWPRESKMVLKLTSIENGVKKIHYNYSGSKIYGFIPVKFSINITSSKNHGIDNIYGFIIKFWTWNGTEISYNSEKGKMKREVNQVEKASKNMKSQRSNFTNQTYNNVYKTKLRYLKETILLIVFNSTHMKAENTSQSNIVQFCQNPIDSSETICQPDIKYQDNSLIIADIDNDGSKELVSFYSTFIDDNHEDNIINSRWKLKSFVQLFKLETELPKLYRTDYDIF
ncbi:uncharacterized protein [Chironomus tepperi]|uniref:uncharacterized protein n=1 Tax=Chironomus tepperi TaxID=113505 RepID=UPI00391F5330